jgi:hypothetical protein
MRKHGASPDDILRFIKSEHCNLAFEGIIHLDARTVKRGAYPADEHPLQKLINVAPGGISFRRAIAQGEFSDIETDKILSAAAKKFLMGAKGELEVQISGGVQIKWVALSGGPPRDDFGA